MDVGGRDAGPSARIDEGQGIGRAAEGSVGQDNDETTSGAAEQEVSSISDLAPLLWRTVPGEVVGLDDAHPLRELSADERNGAAGADVVVEQCIRSGR